MLLGVLNWILSIQLTKTNNPEIVKNSPFIWSDRNEGGFKLTTLGFLNGILIIFGIVLVKYIDDENNNRVIKFALKKKWW